MILVPDLYFADGCGRCKRYATDDCSARRFAAGLAELRRICVGQGLEETAKWGHPCYAHARRNVAILGAFQDNFRLSFFHAALLRDPEGLLHKQGPHTRHADMLRFTSLAQVLELRPAIQAFLAQAMACAAEGQVPARTKVELELPAELLQALAADTALAAAFERLTPGRQRSYVIALSSAKTSATRQARIVRWHECIFNGKGALERWARH